ncbi:conjugal transfer protein [Listeria booriae]|uniref:conjugal transfer protein n=1 Tax=Listeria booriae TaxID=1552123 RepID=UPI0016284334|nr:conjugal transfer protein [Listeria booriae]MBC1248118.1 conjugal transfer protein [Listeria booriae]MBC1287310.1 conjugal transfer protein [Listeria booriae]
MTTKKGKEFIFPENVDSKYGVFLGLGLLELVKYILPLVIGGFLFIAIPPYNVGWMITKIILVLIIGVIAFGLLAARPIKARPNIRIQDHLKIKSQYKKRQKLFFKQRTKRI